MKYTCKFCGGRGKQNGLSCISCKGRRFFDVDGKIEGCKVCKGSGRSVIKTLPCIRCSGRGFSISTKITERTLPGPPEEKKEIVSAEQGPSEEKPVVEEILEQEYPSGRLPASLLLELEMLEAEAQICLEHKLSEKQTLPQKGPETRTTTRLDELLAISLLPGEKTVESSKEPTDMPKKDRRKMRKEKRKREEAKCPKNNQVVL